MVGDFLLTATREISKCITFRSLALFLFVFIVCRRTFEKFRMKKPHTPSFLMRNEMKHSSAAGMSWAGSHLNKNQSGNPARPECNAEGDTYL